MKHKTLYTMLYIFAFAFLLIYLVLELLPNINMSEVGRLILLCGSCVFLYFAGLTLAKYKNNNKPMIINLWVFFILYLILLITLTLFDNMWGRNISLAPGKIQNINLTPFKTIVEYIKEFNSLYSTKQVLLNLFGNFIAFMPFAFFLPLLFKKLDKFKNFFLTTSVLIIFIEIIQLITSTGRFDIDDYILNIIGAVIMYGIFKIKSIKHLIRNIFLLEKNHISKQNYIKIFIFIFIVILISVLIVKYRNNLYDKNLNEYMQTHNPKIQIIDDTIICDEALEKFYEDELFTYYYPCIKSDKVYALINDKEKYLVKDILNTSQFKYKIDIEKILERFNWYKINYIKEEKNTKINFNIKMGETDYSSPKYSVFIASEDKLQVKFDGKNALFKDNNFNIDLYLIPKEVGQTNIEVTFQNNKIIEKYFYLITIDEFMNVTYKLIK